MSDPYNHFLNPAPMPARPIKMVFELWLAPQVPYLNGARNVLDIKHKSFDYSRVGEIIGSMFYGASCVIAIPNDWIDGITFDRKIEDLEPGIHFSEIFSEYRKFISRRSSNQTGGIIDVRSSAKWQKLKLHSAASPDQVYPPQVLPFCVTFPSQDFAKSWIIFAQDALSNSPVDGLVRSFKGRPAAVRQINNQGILPVWALNELGDIFGVPFEPRARLEFDRGGW
jgi:hypothetical protein